MYNIIRTLNILNKTLRSLILRPNLTPLLPFLPDRDLQPSHLHGQQWRRSAGPQSHLRSPTDIDAARGISSPVSAAQVQLSRFPAREPPGRRLFQGGRASFRSVERPQTLQQRRRRRHQEAVQHHRLEVSGGTHRGGSLVGKTKKK